MIGAKADLIFKDEGGSHRWQRPAPTDKRGRVHTSTITVAVLPEPTPTQVRINDKDLEFKACRGSGAGGQHRNTTDSAVQVTHKPSGLTVRCESERSQHQNRATAVALIRARLWEHENDKSNSQRSESRKNQVGMGERADKRRTVAVQRNSVVDHVTGKTWTLSEYTKGHW